MQQQTLDFNVRDLDLTFNLLHHTKLVFIVFQGNAMYCPQMSELTVKPQQRVRKNGITAPVPPMMNQIADIEVLNRNSFSTFLISFYLSVLSNFSEWIPEIRPSSSRWSSNLGN